MGVRQASENVIFPPLVNSQIFPGIALDCKAQALEQVTTTAIAGHIVGHDSMEIKFIKGVGDRPRGRFKHDPLALIGFSQGIAQYGSMKNASKNLIEVQGANHGAGLRLLKEKQPKGKLIFKFQLVLLYLHLPKGWGKKLLGTGGFKGLKKFSIGLVVVGDRSSILVITQPQNQPRCVKGW